MKDMKAYMKINPDIKEQAKKAARDDMLPWDIRELFYKVVDEILVLEAKAVSLVELAESRK